MLVDHLMLAATAFLLVIGDTTSKSQVREEILPSKEDRQFLLDKDATTEHKHERVPLQMKLPVNKARREQALRNILAARRRQISSPRSVSPRTFKPIANVSEDTGDMLEAQETRNGFFVTALMAKQESAMSDNNEDTEITSSKMGIVEEPSINIEDTSTVMPQINDTVLSYKNELNVSRNSGLSSRMQRNPEESSRRKKIVVMPESLYNHFRPVESNIPVEDMTQFLYFGQKINPENTTTNNTVEMTSVSPNSSNLRRRLNLRKFSTTLSTVPKLEGIMNDEMNTAIEKSTIETKKNPKIKNVFRNTGGYFRKPPVRPSDPTIVTNIILTNKSLSGMELDSFGHVNHLAITHQVAGSQSIHRQTNHTAHSIQLPKESKTIPSYVTPISYAEEINDENYPNDEAIPAETQKQSQLISRLEDNIDSETTTKIPYFHEKTSTAMNSVKTTTENDELRKLTRLSTWMSINPVTSSLKSSTGITLTESSMLNELNPSISMLSDNPYQLHSSLRIVVTEPMPEALPKVSDRDENYSTTISPMISTNASVKVASLHHVTTDETTTPATLLLAALSMPQIEPNAYTMSLNSTHLSRNNTGSASSGKTAMTMLKTEELKGIEKKEKNYDDDAAAAAVAVTASVELLPPLSGIAGIEEARAPLGFSAGSAAVETSTSVGKERDKKALQQHNISRNTTINLLESTTPKIYTTTYPSNWHDTPTVRWNYTAPRDDNDRKINGVVFSNKTSQGKEFEEIQENSGIGGGGGGGSRINSTNSDERLMFTSMDNKTSGGNAMTFYNQTANTDVMDKQIEHETTSSSTVSTLAIPPKNFTDVPKLNNSNEMLNDNDKSFLVTSSSGSERMNMTNKNSSDEMESTMDETTEISKENVKLSVFPVTPIIFSKQDEIHDEDISVEEITLDNSKMLEKPFGIAKELDPSEIQKRYRSQTAMKPEVTVTILPTEMTKPDDERLRFDSDIIRAEPSRPDERSPAVRGRNLSDKSKDKDDVLPIMHLYNTSSIFNGTMKNSDEPATTTVLPSTPERNIDLPTTIPNPISDSIAMKVDTEDPSKNEYHRDLHFNGSDLVNSTRSSKSKQGIDQDIQVATEKLSNTSITANKTRTRQFFYKPGPPEYSGYHPELNKSYFEPDIIAVSPKESFNVSEVITKRHDSDTLATQETVAIVSYILATLVVFPIAVGVGLILRRLIIRNRKVLEESDTSSEISCRKDGLNLENGGFKTSIEKAITKLPRIQHLCHETEKPPPPQSQESRWEFPRDKLRLQTVLGQGNFGQVWKAEADDLTGHQGTTRLVAVKTVKEGASSREKEDLIKELEIMQQLGNHPNVVTLLGCCTEEEPHYLILEYVMYGKLLAYLRDHRTRQDFYNFSEDSAALTSRDLTVFGYCVARGMEYLASKKIIHRDLAARNVLVDHNKLCKIADFGMSRFANEDGECIETRHGRNALPIRWMAPESLIYSLFTTKTDVWSFGILMWEIVTLGSTPYPDMAAREVMRNVQNGYRLERPSHCHSELFRVIARCWHADPDRRAEFQTLRRDLAQLLEDNMHGHYVDLESFASECTD